MYFYLFWVIYFKVIYSKRISPKYNFGGQQNPEIDKIYNHLYGQNLYFYTMDSFLTVNLFPSLSLEITFKFYTSNLKLIDALNANKYLYFGFNFNLSNNDNTKEKYTTDAFCCAMSQDDVTCYDYVFDTSNSTYVRNKNEELSNNSKIPYGFDNIELNYLNDNVMEYKQYYAITFQKKFNDDFDVSQLFGFINEEAARTGHYVSAFYGIAETEEQWQMILKDDTLYHNTLQFGDGNGSKNKGCSIKLSYSLIFLWIILLLI